MDIGRVSGLVGITRLSCSPENKCVNLNRYMRNVEHKKHGALITVDPTMPDFSKSPFAIKKAERARAFIAKNGLPKDEAKPKKGK
jgi:hypothetical protein